MEQIHQHNQVDIKIRLLLLIIGFLFMIAFRPVISDQISNRGLIFYNTYRYKTAIWYFRKALLLDSTSPTANLFLASCYEKMGHYKEAVATYKRYIKINPSFARTYFYLGVLYANLKDWQRALTCFKKAIKKDRRYWQAYLWINTCYKKLGRDDMALKNLEKMKKIFPSNQKLIDKFIAELKGK